MTPETRAAIFRRDRVCFLSKDDPDHQCRNIYGEKHAAGDWSQLTLEHVKDELAMGKRAPSDEAHMLVLCGWSNFMVPSKDQRERMRAYLREVNA